jgi:hypothetical protein
MIVAGRRKASTEETEREGWRWVLFWFDGLRGKTSPQQQKGLGEAPWAPEFKLGSQTAPGPWLVTVEFHSLKAAQALAEVFRNYCEVRMCKVSRVEQWPRGRAHLDVEEPGPPEGTKDPSHTRYEYFLSESFCSRGFGGQAPERNGQSFADYHFNVVSLSVATPGRPVAPVGGMMND